jgi:membrane-bound lytic murein transglycosylase D
MKNMGSFIGCLVIFLSCNTDQKVTIPVKLATGNQFNESFIMPKIPHVIYFCGQEIRLIDEDIRERLDRELLVNTFYQSATIQYIKRANRFFPQIEKILKEEGIPDDFKYLAVIESGLTQAVSPAGAQGIWQFMPKTAEQFKLEITDEVDERLHLEKSTRATCAYLKQAYDTLGDWLLAAASFNRGINGVRNDMRWQESEHYFDTEMNSETGRYTFRILAMKLILSDPEKYGFNRDQFELYEPFQTKSITVKASIPNLAFWAKNKGFNFKILNKLNPWLKTNRLTVSNNKRYYFLLPTEAENLKPYKAYFK